MREEPFEKKSIEEFLRLLEKRSNWRITPEKNTMVVAEAGKIKFSQSRLRELAKLSRFLKIR